jgi:hypothetical protein
MSIQEWPKWLYHADGSAKVFDCAEDVPAAEADQWHSTPQVQTEPATPSGSNDTAELVAALAAAEAALEAEKASKADIIAKAQVEIDRLNDELDAAHAQIEALTAPPPAEAPKADAKAKSDKQA